MSLQELQDEAARLSPEDRARLRAHLDSLEIFGDAKVMEEWTHANRAAAAGAVISREEAMARLQARTKDLDKPRISRMTRIERTPSVPSA